MRISAIVNTIFKEMYKRTSPAVNYDELYHNFYYSRDKYLIPGDFLISFNVFEMILEEYVQFYSDYVREYIIEEVITSDLCPKIIENSPENA